MISGRGRWGKHPWRPLVPAAILAIGWLGCEQGGGLPAGRDDLDAMDTARISIGDNHFEVWLATSAPQQQRGLMQVTSGRLAPIPGDPAQGSSDVHRGMLFVFEMEQPLSFWMWNTITPLDIAYIRADGLIVSTYTMAPMETRSYPSGEPAQFALEVLAGLFTDLGIGPGDRVEIPDSVLKGTR